MSSTVPSVSARVARMDMQVPGSDGGGRCACCQPVVAWFKACCPCCFTPKCKNAWALVFEILGIVGLALSLAMIADVDDIIRCKFTSGIYFTGIALSVVFFVATVSRLCGYEGFFHAHPICRASTFLHTCCCGDGCDGMTDYREGAFQDSHVLAYIFLNTLIPGELIPFAASYIDHINGYVKAVGLKIEHPVALWFAIVARPLMAFGQVVLAAYNVHSQDGCSKLFKSLVGLGIVYVVILWILYGVVFAHVLDDVVCPRFFKNEQP